MEIKVTTPNRIDLAGGTTDLYPLYLFMDGGCTVNAAITLHSAVTLRPRNRGDIEIISEDLSERTEASQPQDLPLDGPLGMIGRAVKVLLPSGGLEIVTANQAPAGSGLGASSALLVALVEGLLLLNDIQEDRHGVIDLAADIETAQIGVPTGKQDYIAAAFGGVSVIDFGYRGFVRRTPSIDSGFPEWLESTLVLSYTGEGRFSGMNNWEVTKAFIDNKDSVREKLIQIRDVARQMGEAILSRNYDGLPALVRREWEIRRTLAPGVSTPRTDSIMNAAGEAGALASKICGAGGGGCMITLIPSERRSAVENAIAEAGGRVIPVRIDREGLRVEKSGN